LTTPTDEYNRHSPAVPAIARSIARRLPHGIGAEDLAQIGRIALWQACEAYDETHAATFRIYLRQRIRGAMLDAVRGREYREAQREDAAEREGLEAISQKSDNPDPFIARAVDELPARQRAVIRLRYRDQRSRSDTAQRLGISPATAGRDEAAAIAALRERLAA
jgi:RNA polymerase sigma factor (sigma-70 family)